MGKLLTAAALTVALALSAAAVASAQARPNFAGIWVLDEGHSTTKTSGQARDGAGASLPLGDTTIEQSPTTLTISNDVMGSAVLYVLKLDGSTSVNRNGAMTQTTRTHWNGQQLVTEGSDAQVTSQGAASWTLKAVRSIDTAGRLIVDNTSNGSNGTVTTTHQVFIRKK